MIGYHVGLAPQLASFRLRVAIPAAHMGLDYIIGGVGEPTFFYKHQTGDLDAAVQCKGGVVFDVVNDHFSGKYADHYKAMCQVADTLTVSSPVMAQIVRDRTYRDAVVITDPYENECWLPQVIGKTVLWFGHGANLSSLAGLGDVPDLQLCTGEVWSAANERRCLAESAVVLLTGSNAGASANRVVKALRAGRFVVTPGGIESWNELADFIWIGDVHEGIRWALNNREDACKRIAAGQEYVRDRFSPQTVGKQWASLFGSTLAQATRKSPAGPL